jgi:hypothetical protein
METEIVIRLKENGEFEFIGINTTDINLINSLKEREERFSEIHNMAFRAYEKECEIAHTSFEKDFINGNLKDWKIEGGEFFSYQT